MRFWDTSALVPLTLEQESTETVTQLLVADPEIAAWWGTAVECASAAARLRRDDGLTLAEEDRALAIIRRLRESWVEVLPSEEVLGQATRLLSGFGRRRRARHVGRATRARRQARRVSESCRSLERRNAPTA